MPPPPRPAGRLPRGRYNEIALKQDKSSGYAALRHGTGLIDRRRPGRILLTGRDRRAFLRRRFTNSILPPPPRKSYHPTHLSSAGRNENRIARLPARPD